MYDTKENIQTLILRCEENIQRIEDRLDDITSKFENDLQSYLIRSQLEFLLLNTLENKFSKERQLQEVEQQEQWSKDHPTTPLGPFIPSALPFLPIESTPGSIKPEDVESTVTFQHNSNPGLGCVVFKMKAGIYLDPLSRSLWTPTEDWKEKKSLPGLSL